ncbi:MAG: PCRF domain-containing protein [Phycisphaerales bacterium]|nr:PCRF domain-containing protein [Phycisphaerales bacterium]
MSIGTIDPNLASKLNELRDQFDDLSKQLEDPEVLADHKRVSVLSIKRSALAPVVEGYIAFCALVDESTELSEAITGDDPELAEMAKEELPEIESQASKMIEQIKQTLVTTDDRAIGSVMLEIRAGTGGDEAALWARDLLAAYTKYATAQGWKTEELDMVTDAGFGGIRHAVINFQGDGVWQQLSFEAGVHAVKRVPETETQGRVHTSTCTVAVLPEPEAVEVNIDWSSDVEEHITTAQGPGGQNVNKVATAVHMIHKPTGVEVRMQETKSQAQNREKAKRLLTARVYEIERQKIEAERTESRNSQIGTGGRSEKIRVYRYQDNIVADQRLDIKFNKNKILDDADLGPMFDALIEQETARRLAEL